jgi:uncharacterized protein (TIGR03118 family)
MVESLEDRTLLASTITISLFNALTFTASAVPNDSITLSFAPATYTIHDALDVINVTNSGTATVSGSGTNTVKVSNVASLAFSSGGAKGDTFNIQSAANPVTLTNSFAGTMDTVNLGAAGSTAGLNTTVTLGAGAGSTALSVDDSASTSNAAVTLTSGSPNGTIVGLSPQTITFATAALNSLTLSGGKGINAYSIVSTPPTIPTTLNTGTGTSTVKVLATSGPLKINDQGVDSVTIANTAAGSINGTVNVVGNPASTELVLDDSLDTSPRTVLVTDGQVIGLFPQAVTFDPDALTLLTILGGTRFMTLNVNAGRIGPVDVEPGATNGSGTISIDNTAPIKYVNATAVNVTNSADQLLTPLNKPVVTTTGDAQLEGKAASLLVASFKDADPDAKAGNFTVKVNWGDGTVDTAAAIATNDNTEFDISTTHTYLEEGKLNVIVSVYDTGTSDTSFIGGIPVTVSDIGGSALTSGVTTEVNLTSDGTPPASHIDPNLVNPWDIAYGPTGSFWVTDNKKGVATLYDGSGVPQPPPPNSPLVVTIPPPSGKNGPSSPTGVVFNSDASGFKITAGGVTASSTFLFATADGTISGWNGNVPPPMVSTQVILAVDHSSLGAVYTGLAEANVGASTMLYVANFHAGDIEVYNNSFGLVGSFSDPNVPDAFAPYGIRTINGNLYVTFAMQDAAGRNAVPGLGQGFVDVFSPAGVMISRLISNAPLNAPYGLALAPSNFGQFSNDLLVGNNGDGRVNAFDPNSGVYQGAFFDSMNNVVSIDGLHGLAFGSGQGAGATNTLYFVSGPDAGTHGLFGSVNATPNTVTIGDTALHATISGIAAIEGIPFSGVVGTITDDNPRPDINDFTATIDWGDGKTTAGAITSNNTPGAGFIVTATHTFPEETTGGPPLKTKITITDAGGSSAFAQGAANISDAKLVPSDVQPTILAREDSPTGDMVVATFVDENPNAPLSDYQAPYLPTIAWGDGKTSFGTVVRDPSVAGLLDVIGSHTYTDETLVNPATVTVTLNDEGGSKATAITFAIVSDATIVATGLTLPNPYTPPLFEGKAFTGDVAKLLDSNALATAGNFTVSIDWGDGIAGAPDITPGTVRQDASGAFTVSGSHTYAEEGTYKTSIFIKDVGGATATAVGSAIVSDAPLQATALAVSATEGATFTAPVMTFTDGNPLATPAEFTAAIAWGDGGITAGTVVQPDGPGTKFTVVGTYTYGEDGKFTIGVAVVEPGGSRATTGAVSGNGAMATVADARLSAAPAAAQPNINAIVTAATGSPVTEGTSFTSPVAVFTDAAFPLGVVGPFTASIDWGDGTSSSGSPAIAGGTITVTGTHTYTETKPGGVPFSVKVTLNDRDGSNASTTRSLVVADAALTPLGSIPIAAIEGQPVNDVVVGSFGDANPTSTASDFSAQVTWGDGTPPFAAQVVETAFHQFDVVASHTYAEDTTGAPANAIIVTIFDNEGSMIIRNNTATVLDAPLESVGAPSIGGVAGVALSVSNGFFPDVATFTDANPDAPIADFAATIFWGDGQQSPGIVRLVGAGPGRTGVVGGDHTYAAPGDYQISVLITDAGGSRTYALSETIIVPGRIVVAAANQQAQEGVVFAGQVARFVDVNPAEVAGNFVAMINWGDGIITPGVVAAAGGAFTVSGTHTYEEGVYPYSVTVTDENNLNAIGTATFTVADGALTPVPAAPLKSIAGQTLINVPVGSFSDANPRATTDDFSVSIDWGDGSPLDAGTVVKGPGFFDVVGTHKYVKEGLYDISVFVVDIGGANTTLSNAVTVGDAPLQAYSAELWATEGVPVFQVVATFTDADPTSTTADIKDILVDWGDGTQDHLGANVAFAQLGAAPDGVTYVVSGSHTYNDDEVQAEVDGYQVLVVVTDVGGSVTEAASSANVADPTLADPPFPVQAVEGAAFNGKIASFTDSNPYMRAADFSATLTWGDGESSAGTITTNPAGGFFVIGNHTYAQAGGYITGVTIRDHFGHMVSDGSTATVADASLTSSALAISAKPRAQFQSPVATFTDANVFALPANFSASILWGDGTTTNGVVVASGTSSTGSTFTVDGSHQYRKQGDYAVTVIIGDSGGTKAVSSGTAIISAKAGKVVRPKPKPPKSHLHPMVSTKSTTRGSAPKAPGAPTVASSQVDSPLANGTTAAPAAIVDLALQSLTASGSNRRFRYGPYTNM